MADNTNPSIVNDESGNNYGGINIGDAKLQYLENLNLLAQKMSPKPLRQEEYFPNSNQGVVQGNISSRTLGNVPLIATGPGLIPFGIMDEMERSKAEAEAKYYEGLKSEMDKPLFAQKLQLADPWRQPAFSQKVMDTADSYLSLYTKRFGGDTIKAYIATKNDKNFQKTIQSYQQYADMYNTVYQKAIEIEAARKSEKTGMDIYVDQDASKAIDRFLYSHENLTNLKPDELLDESKRIYSTLSATKLAESLTAGYKDQIKETNFAKSASMSTDELDVYINKLKTNEGAAEQIIKGGEEAYPWLKGNPEQKAIFERSIRNRVAFGETQAIKEIKKNNATRDLGLRKLGWMDDKGQVQFQKKTSALVNAVGENAVSYPMIEPIPTAVGMKAFVISDGQLHYVQLPESYAMQPTAEYDITKEGTGVMRGRYVEGKINFQSSQPYTPPDVVLTGTGKNIQRTIMEGKKTTQVVPSQVEDIYTHELITLLGETTVLTPYDNMKSTVEAVLPNLGYVHEQLDKRTVEGERRAYSSGTSNPEAIPLTDSMTMDDIKPELQYIKNGRVVSGTELWDKYNAQKKK